MKHSLYCIVLLLAFGALHAQLAIGDTLTVIQRPILSVPAITTPGETFVIECDALSSASGWTAELVHDSLTLPLNILSANYDGNWERWFLEVATPTPELYELYDLRVSASGVETDTAKNAVCIIPAYRDSYSFVHITDTHMPTHYFLDDPQSLTDSSEIADLRDVIEDLNVIAPEFVLLSGDVVNEGELEDLENRRYYTRAKRVLGEFEVPVFLTAGNHDVGGWDSTPAPDGTARRDWWRFFGWKRLNDPPPFDPYYTQNYSFTYGDVAFIGLEGYINYDGWRYGAYGGESFTVGQMQWLDDQMDLYANAAARVLFYHYDFSYQIDLDALGAQMALWGHIHYNSGSIYSQPWDLGTESVCDGDRAFRLVSVNNGQLAPHLTLNAGQDGDIDIDWTPANDGQHQVVTASVNNTYSRNFPNARLKFVMPAGEHDYEVDGGELEQVDRSGEHDICYVRVDLPPSAVTTVTLGVEGAGVSPGDISPVDLALFCRPNPFNPSTTFSFSLPQPGHAQLRIYNIRGELVRTLVDASLFAGGHAIPWRGDDDHGVAVGSGVYLYRLRAGGIEATGKCLLLK